jgi:hypothetical protein
VDINAKEFVVNVERIMLIKNANLNVKNYLNVDIIVNKIAMVKKIAKFVIKNA